MKSTIILVTLIYGIFGSISAQLPSESFYQDYGSLPGNEVHILKAEIPEDERDFAFCPTCNSPLNWFTGKCPNCNYVYGEEGDSTGTGTLPISNGKYILLSFCIVYYCYLEIKKRTHSQMTLKIRTRSQFTEQKT